VRAQIITNGSKLSDAWMTAYAPYLDMLGVSFDTASDALNHEQGRWTRGARAPEPTGSGSRGGEPQGRALRHLLRAASLSRAHGVELKVNTVVTRKNAGEDLSAVINEAAPSRWKVLQVLALEGENAGPAAINDVAPLLLPRAAYDAFVDRNRAGLATPSVLVPEPNDVMISSYILLDEHARFLDSSTGGKTPTCSILDVGVSAAAAELLSSAGGGHNAAAFKRRDGDFYCNTGTTPLGPPGGGAAAAETVTRAAAARGFATAAAPALPAAPVAAAAAAAPHLEVEVKFEVPRHFADTLTHRFAASPPRIKTFTDTYYERSGRPLTTRDMWLRQRGATVELKWPAAAAAAAPSAPSGSDSTAPATGTAAVDAYNESTDWPTISGALQATAGVAPLPTPYPATPDALAAYMAAAGYTPFAVLTTTRSRYALTIRGARVFVDIDRVTFLPPRGGGAGAPLGEYSIGEVELVAAGAAAEAGGGGGDPRAAVAGVLTALLRSDDAPRARPVRGKVLEYLARHDAPHYAALGASGLLASKLGPHQGAW
jgi:hypothetical protein